MVYITMIELLCKKIFKGLGNQNYFVDKSNVINKFNDLIKYKDGI